MPPVLAHVVDWHRSMMTVHSLDCTVVVFFGLQNEHQHKRKRSLVQNGIKRDCKAVIHITEMRRFPQFKVHVVIR